MLSSFDSADVIPSEQPREDIREVIYLVKRPSYTLAIAAPRPSPTRLSRGKGKIGGDKGPFIITDIAGGGFSVQTPSVSQAG